jgi:hypothetical protein
MKKLLLLLLVLLSLSLFADIGGGGKKNKCVCLGVPDQNDGRCTMYSASHPTRTGAFCSHSSPSNFDCYATQCESNGGGGGNAS